MTVTSSIRTAGPFDGDDTSSDFAFEFKVFAESDVIAQVTDENGALTTLELDSDYTVQLNGDQNESPGGLITLTDPLADGSSLMIGSNVQALQATSLQNTGGMYPRVVENMADRAIILLQQLGVGASNGNIRVPEITGVQVLPSSLNRLDRLVGFNSATGDVAVSTFTMTQVASAVAAAYTAGQSTADAVAFVAAGTAWIRTVQEKARDTRSVRDFGAIGSGGTQLLSSRYASLALAQVNYPFATSLTQSIDYCAIQAAINYAESIVESATFGGTCVKIDIPEGDYYLGSDTLSMTLTGVFLQGVGGRGSRIWTNQNTGALVIGDPTDTDSTFFNFVDGIFFDSEDNDNTASGIKLCKAFFGGITNCLIRNFDNNIETARANRYWILDNKFSGQRTVIGTAHIRISGSASGNGGGLHIHRNEIGSSNGGLMPDYTNGVLINNVDGCYYGGNHVRDVAYGMQIAPTGAADKNFISDVLSVGPNYMDETYSACLRLGGSIAAGGTYQNIQYVGGLLRGGNGSGTYAPYCVDIDIQDAGGFVAGGGFVEDITIRATLRQARTTAIRARGSSNSRIEVRGLDTDGCHFDQHNTSGSSLTSCVDVEVGSIRAMNWTVLPDANAATQIANINVSSAGGGVPSCIEGNHDLTRVNCTGEPVVVTVTGSPANVLRVPSLLASMGKRLMTARTTTTTDRSVSIIWSRTIESGGQICRFNFSVLGISTSGTFGSVYANYEINCSVRRQSGGNAAVLATTEVAAHGNPASNDAPVKVALLTGTAWSGGAAATAKDMITSGGNVYLALVTGTLHATDPPVHTSSVVTNGSVPLAYVGAVAVNTLAVMVSGQATTDMQWVIHPDFKALP